MKKLLAAIVLVAGLAFIACQKEYSYENGSDVTSNGAWEFRDSANVLYSGNPVEYYIDDTTTPGSAHMVYSGATAALNATISIEVFFPTDSARIGTYTSAAGQVSFLYLTNTNKYFKADAFSTGIENISVVISQISDTSVTGTFSGTALDSANRVLPVRAGKFTFRKRSQTVPTASVGALGAATDTSCTGAVVSGTYRKSSAMTSSNLVSLTTNITTVGSYTIYTDTLKGIYFRGTGNFTTTGVQNVTVPAIGTPTDTGTVRFHVRYLNTVCTFTVRIDTTSSVVVIPPTGDYLPLTTNSNWSYDVYDLPATSPSDTTYVLSTGGTKTIASNSFNILTDDSFDSAFYRKSAGLYYQGTNLTDLVGAGGEQQTIVLKDNVPSGSTWADSFNVTYLTIPANLKISYTITAKAVSATVGNFTYPDVIKVVSVYTLRTTGIPTPPTTVATDEFWYARGTGVIYEKYIDQLTVPSSTTETRLRRSQIF